MTWPLVFVVLFVFVLVVAAMCGGSEKMKSAMYPLYVVDTFHNYNTGERGYRLCLLWRLLTIRIPRRRMTEMERIAGHAHAYDTIFPSAESIRCSFDPDDYPVR